MVASACGNRRRARHRGLRGVVGRTDKVVGRRGRYSRPGLSDLGCGRGVLRIRIQVTAMMNTSTSASRLGVLIRSGRQVLNRASEWMGVETHISVLMRPQQIVPRERRNLTARRTLMRRIVG